MTKEEFLELNNELLNLPGMTIALAADLIGVGIASVWRWKGGGNPSKPTVLLYGKKLKKLVIKHRDVLPKEILNVKKGKEDVDRLVSIIVDMRKTLTMKEIANVIGVDQFQISKWTRGYRKPTARDAKRFLKKLA